MIRLCKALSIGLLIGVTLNILPCFADNELPWATYLNTREGTDSEHPGKKESIDIFCRKIKNKEYENVFGPASQSVFVYLLCNYGHPIQNDFFETDGGTLKDFIKEDFSLNKIGYFNNRVQNLGEYHENYNIPQLSEDLLTIILSEYFTIKEASIFGLKQTNLNNKKAYEERIDDYAKNYLNVTKFCSNSDKEKQYKKTCKVIKSQLTAFEKAIKKTKVINTSKLYEVYNDKKSSICNIESNSLYCGLIGFEENGLSTFKNLIINELHRYTVFLTYYGMKLSTRPELNEKLRFEYQQALASPEKMQEITFYTLTDIISIQSTYPIHVMLLAYQEDLLRLRDKLAKIVTPIYCINKKFRNVQVKE